MISVVNILELEAKLKKHLSEKRFNHTLAVRDTALSYAKLFKDSGLDFLEKEKTFLDDEYLKKIEIAALLHDYAKEFSNDDQISLAKFYGLDIYEEDLDRPNLLHARVGAALVEEEFDIYDHVILKAIKEHTFAGRSMSFASKIVFLADMTEPGRDKKEPSIDLQIIRELISKQQSLDAALFLAAQKKIEYVLKQRKMLHPLSLFSWNYLVKKSKIHANH